MISLKSKITKTLLNYFMLHDHTEMYVNEMARQFHLDSGNLARKLIELEKEGILKSRTIGDQKHYSLNKKYSMIKEYRKIILKTIGVERALQDALQAVPGIQNAYIFGSYAADRMSPSSDIDLLVTGNHDNVALQKHVARVQKVVDREINLISMSSQEYARKVRTDSLLKTIAREPKVTLI